MKSNQNYIAQNQSRDVRPLLLQGLNDFKRSSPTQAVDFGCGLGIETAYLVANYDCRVLAIDGDPFLMSKALEKVKGPLQGKVTFVNSPFEKILELPLTDFFYSYHSLHFVSIEHYERLWTLITRSIKSKGRVVLSLFGEGDYLVKTKQAIGISRNEIYQKLSGFEINYFQSVKNEGDEFLHYYDVIATKV